MANPGHLKAYPIAAWGCYPERSSAREERREGLQGLRQVNEIKISRVGPATLAAVKHTDIAKRLATQACKESSGDAKVSCSGPWGG